MKHKEKNKKKSLLDMVKVDYKKSLLSKLKQLQSLCWTSLKHPKKIDK